MKDLNQSTDLEAKPTGRRRYWPLGVGLAVLIALLVVLAQQGGGGGAGGPLNAMAEAAAKTRDAGGGRLAIHGVMTDRAGSRLLVFSGHGIYSGAGSDQGTLMTSKAGSNESVKMDFVQDGTMMYMRSSKFGTLPDDRQWVGLDLALGEELESSVPPGGDAMGELELLEKAVGGVDKVGKENVHGVATIRYRGRLDVSESAKRLREEGGEDAAAIVEKHAAPLQMEAWIDGKGLVRRMRVLQLRPSPGGDQTLDMRTDFYDFGFEPEIDVPDSDEVFDATSLAKEQLESSGDE